MRATHGRAIDWRDTPFGDGWEDVERDVIVWIDVAAFDAAWRETDQWIGPGGTGGQDDRYKKFGAWFVQGRPVRMCVAWSCDGEVGFTNGRHRFAWLRDQGVIAMPMQIGPDAAAKYAQRFGTMARESFVPE